jgi:glucose/arabinose dehydrogenase
VDKRLRILGIVAAVAVSILILSSPSRPIPLPDPTLSSNGTSDAVEILATGLEKPRSVDIASDGRIFVTEKIGKIRVIENNVLLDEPLAVLRTADVFDGGLLGVATHPNFANNHMLYVYYTYVKDDNLWNKVLRITESDNKLVDAITILDDIPGSRFSNGGVIKFGPDNKLYVATGSISDSLNVSQDMESLAGKVLRINDDGSIPEDNPFSDDMYDNHNTKLIYSLGFRNPQGMTWDNLGNMYVSDLGPGQNDEINVVTPASNFGWPHQECADDHTYTDAIVCYDPAIEPGGMIYYTGNKLDLDNKFIISSLRTSNLFEVDVYGDGISDNNLPTSQKTLLTGLGRIRDVNQDNNGNIYIITSNTDGKGFPDGDDDKLVRIVK